MKMVAHPYFVSNKRILTALPNGSLNLRRIILIVKISNAQIPEQTLWLAGYSTALTRGALRQHAPCSPNGTFRAHPSHTLMTHLVMEPPRGTNGLSPTPRKHLAGAKRRCHEPGLYYSLIGSFKCQSAVTSHVLSRLYLSLTVSSHYIPISPR